MDHVQIVRGDWDPRVEMESGKGPRARQLRRAFSLRRPVRTREEMKESGNNK